MSYTETAPDYVPEHIQRLHLDEAREQLRHTPVRRLQLVDADKPAGASDGRVRPPARRVQPSAIAAVLIGLPGVMALTGVWAWLLVTRPSPVWWALTALGAALSLVGLVSAVRIGLAVRKSRAQPAAVTPVDPAPAAAVSPVRDAA